jgi:hypothetical protein
MSFGPTRNNRGAGNPGEQLVQFRLSDAERISKAVTLVEGMRRPRNPSVLSRSLSPDVIYRICTFTGSWNVNEPKVVTFRNQTSPPNTAVAFNVIAHITGSTQTMTCAIAKEGTAWYLVDGPDEASEITPGSLVSPIAVDDTWQPGEFRRVRITDTSNEVDVLNPFDDLTHLEGHEGVLFARSSKNPLGGDSTANVLISPAPKELWEARFSSGNDEEWPAGQDKQLIVPSGDGRNGDTLVTVKNKFFDAFAPGTGTMAIGRVGGEFCVLTRPTDRDVLLANRNDDSEWSLGSERDVQVHGSTRTISAINLAGDYEAFDAKDQDQGPNLLLVRGEGTGPSTAKQWYVVAPPPLRFDTGTWDGEWAAGSQKSFYLDSVGASVEAINDLFDLPTGASGAVAKVKDEWKLVSVQLETFTGTIIESSEQKPYASEVENRTVVLDVDVSGEIKQSAASPVTIAVNPVYANYLVVTGVDVTAVITQSAASPVTVGATVHTANMSVLQDINITATLNTANCDITVFKTPVTGSVAVATGVSIDAGFDVSKLNVSAFANPTYSNLQVLNQVAVAATFDVTKLYVELETTATTANITAVTATAMGTFVTATQTATFIRFPSEAL